MFILLFCCGGGRANGFGGPVAPAERSVWADGDGGGRTMPEECESDAWRRVVWDVDSVELRGEFDSAVALPPSEGSSGISTLKRGRAPPPSFMLLVRDGGVNVVSGIDDTEMLRLLFRD